MIVVARFSLINVARPLCTVSQKLHTFGLLEFRRA